MDTVAEEDYIAMLDKLIKYVSPVCLLFILFYIIWGMQDSPDTKFLMQRRTSMTANGCVMPANVVTVSHRYIKCL